MSNKLSYEEQIRLEINKSRKARDAARLHYYIEALDKIACASYERFKGSWAYSGWFMKNKDKIEEFRDEQNRRFGYMGKWS